MCHGTQRWWWIPLVFALMLTGCGGGGSSGSTSVVIRTLHINPTQASLYFGDELLLTVSGGTPPYTWSSTNLTVGAIDQSRIGPNGSSAYFVANTKRPEEGGENLTAKVQVLDAEGHTAECTITLVEFLLLVTPSQATLALDTTTTPSIRFFVTGGEPPYFWSADKPYLADIFPNGDGSVLTVLPKLAGTLTLTVSDARNRRNSAVLTVVEETPGISPSVLTASVNDTVHFRVSGGTPPYTAYVSDPNVAQILSYDGVSSSLDVKLLQVGQSDVVVEDAARQKAFANVTVTDLQSGIALSPSGAAIDTGEFVRFTVQHGLAPYFWTNENPELGDLIPSGAGNGSAVFYAGSRGGVVTVVVEDSRQVRSVGRITIAQSMRILPGRVTAEQGTSGLVFAVFGGVPPYSAFLKDYRFGSVTQPAFNATTNQYEFTVTVSSGAEAKTWSDVIEVYDVSGIKAAVDVKVLAAGSGDSGA